MFCRYCGAKLNDDSVFCQFCGQKLVLKEDAVSSSSWYYSNGSQAIGPVDESEINKLISNGTIKENTMLWTNSLKSWTLAINSPFSRLFEESFVIQNAIVSDKWIWALVSIPPFIGLVLPTIMTATSSFSIYIPLLVVIVLNSVFILCDVNEVKKAGLDINSLLWLGLILVPLYIYVREEETNKHYLPLVVWCILFVLYLFVSIT